jgi:hypothetical protein
MGWTDVYLLPQGSDREPADYAARAAEVLLGMGVISVGGYEYEGWFGLGDRHLLPFLHEPDHEYGFDHCVIYGRPALTLVPASPEVVAPHCPACAADVGREYHALLFDDDGEETPVWDGGLGDARITCPRCGRTFRPDRLNDRLGGGIYLTDKYVHFSDGIPALKPAWAAEFDRLMGCRHAVRTYWGT